VELSISVAVTPLKFNGGAQRFYFSQVLWQGMENPHRSPAAVGRFLV
jgi:hypothetical protein